MDPDHWHQHNVIFTDRESGKRAITERLGPSLLAAEETGQLDGWWFMNKQPWPLRYRAARPSPLVQSVLSELVDDGTVKSWLPGIYEPESTAFGGALAMDATHDLFHEDSRHLLTYHPGQGHLGRRETAVLLISAMLRAANQDWFEQGDVWAKAAELRPATESLTPERAAVLIPAMRTLMTVDAHSLCHQDRPLDGHAEWVAAFERAGTTLANLATGGGLSRGLRAIIAHHVIFHANRAGLLPEDQSALLTIAREAVMGSSDNPASSAEDRPETTSFGAVTTDTIAPNGAEAARLRDSLVDQIREYGYARLPAVEAALRAVPRHLFVPDAPLEDAYANATVAIKQDTDGTVISCASQPSVVAAMLDQLEAQPGNRILELGAGTGYNAALLAHLVGDAGYITTIDVDEDLVEGARAHLAAAGFTNVDVLTRDGALGHAEGGPYDRIIATVGAHGVPHTWLDQLAPGGRLVVPQRLKGSVSRSIAYEQHDGRWTSVSSKMNTFMPLRRGIADDDRRVIPLSIDGTVRLQAPAGQSIDADALAGVLDQPRTEEWTGMTVQAMENPEWMELFVACYLPSGLIRMPFPAGAKGALLTDDPYPSSTAAVDKGALTYLARRVSEQTTPEGDKLWEFGVIGHGPSSNELTARVADAIRTWDRDFRAREASFEIQRLDAPAIEQRPGLFAVGTPLNRIIIDWQ
ncbi:protein-L-isoaspartate(D-aspartate) O-methyltransferase [Streptomyces sp. DvalAA-14]|uniref:methyltransferase, FxLD system n=1 Tax=unclassified Streptomyces TaxID=2593676 RepID=UPI00081BB038|nr:MULTISPECIES: methyltransferase, FxLD system [unclassified Streptomyces]MYS23588.1 methyltransferase, FxLD system [Streptomyces sp. SID4948]SCE35755.1 protein-L-isoaspartate(D-aspartate) O-methyltransferase [Streptomyces sp. DvalAA-14]